VSSTLVAATVALLAALALLAWMAALPGWRSRLAAAAGFGLAVWPLMPIAIDTGLRDMEGALEAGGWARAVATLATLDAMVVATLATRRLWGESGRREQWLLQALPPAGTPIAAFGLCLLAAQSSDTLDFATLRTAVAVACVPALAALAALFGSAVPGANARLELRLVTALLLLVAAAVLAGFATAAPGVSAPSFDGAALGAIIATAAVVGAAGFAWERRRSRR
jgi:hypothetical protein